MPYIIEPRCDTNLPLACSNCKLKYVANTWRDGSTSIHCAFMDCVHENIYKYINWSGVDGEKMGHKPKTCIISKITGGDQ